MLDFMFYLLSLCIISTVLLQKGKDTQVVLELMRLTQQIPYLILKINKHCVLTVQYKDEIKYSKGEISIRVERTQCIPYSILKMYGSLGNPTIVLTN